MLSADRLREFQTVVESPSITAAAKMLGLPRATLSRRISGLEKDLGVRLVQRTTRQLALTPAGAELYRRACRVVADTTAAWDAVRRLDGVPRGPLRVAVPDTDLAPEELYLSFAEDFPEVQMEVVVTPRDVDLISEGIDVALRFGHIEQPGLLVKKIKHTDEVVVASPGYLEEHGVPKSVDDLGEHNCIGYFDGDRVRPVQWSVPGRSPYSIQPHFMTNSYHLMISAALRGMGLALLSEGAVGHYLGQGKLVSVLKGQVGGDCPASLVFVEREFQLPQVRAFIDRAAAFYAKLFYKGYAPEFVEAKSTAVSQVLHQAKLKP